MQYVSPEYKESMRQPLRERGYIRVTFGGVNAQAQNAASITSASQVSYSDTSRIFNNGNDDYVYAALEENFIRLDGSKYFVSGYYEERLEKALIGRNLISDEPYQFVISFDPAPVNFNVMVFNFGENYPVSFTLSDGTNSYDFTNDQGRICEIHQDFEEVTNLTMTVTEMLNPDSRFRLYSIRFDSGFEYQNDMVLDSNLDSSISPIGETLPQMNFSVKLVNENHYFDTDNPKSILNQFDTSTEVNVYYGYQLSDHIEWLQGAKLYVESWSSDDKSATIYARDILQANDVEYPGGNYETVTLYNLAVSIFQRMGITAYDIDDSLKSISTVNALPKVSCKQALQIVANAACKKLFIKRDGSVKIGDEIYSYDLTSNGQTAYMSDLQNILEDNVKYEYAALEDNFLKLDGSQRFVTSQTSERLSVGYVSYQVSDGHKLFKPARDMMLSEEVLRDNILNLSYELTELSGSENPILTVSFAELSSVRQIHLVFGTTYATRLIIRTYANEEVVQQVALANNHQRDLTIELENGYADRIDIEFVETAEKYNHIRVNYLEIFRGYSKEFSDIDIMSYPRFDRFEIVQKISVPYYTYVDRESTEHPVEEVLHNGGTVVKWENPLISTETMAQNLLNWLKEYYLLDGIYEFDTRGDPEVDANDDAVQMKYNGDKMQVLITDLSLGFNGSFSGSVKTLKRGDLI